MAFHHKLENRDGTLADPPTLLSAVPTWGPGDTIPLGPGRTLRVVQLLPGREPNDSGVLVVEAA
jgi:hypothetical protein